MKGAFDCLEKTMPDQFTLTPTQITALRALNERIVESSPIEVAVSGLLLPDQARSALAALEQWAACILR